MSPRPDKRIGLDDLAAAIPNRSLLAIPADYSGPAIAATLALLRRGVRDLRLVTAPTSGLQADLLIGAGAVSEIETAGVALGEHGMAHRFRAAISAGTLRIKDATCPALHAGFQAAAKGVPFLPLRGILGSDLLRYRPDWTVIQNPLTEDSDPIVLVPAIHPDVALFHAALADRFGNVWVGVRRELLTLAQAARRTLVTVEAIYDGDLLADPVRAAGTIPHLYIEQVALVPGGTKPLAYNGHATADDAALERYAEASRSQDGFAALLAEWLK